MSTPANDHAYLRELEIDVRTELTVAETSQPGPEAGGPLAGEEIPDPDAERYEIRLRSLLGAVETLEDGPRPGAGTESGEPC